MDAATRQSINYVLNLYGPAEVQYLRTALLEDRVDGGTFLDATTSCGCLVGTLQSARDPEAVAEPDAKINRVEWTDFSKYWLRWIEENAPGAEGRSKPAQRYFAKILPGAPGESATRRQEALAVVEAWLAAHTRNLTPQGLPSRALVECELLKPVP